MTDEGLHAAIVVSLQELVSMLAGDHAGLARRLLRARDECVAAIGHDDLPDSAVRLLRRLSTGTMGAMSDVTIGGLVDGRWVVDEAHERRFRDLSRVLWDQLALLPPSRAPDFYLVTDRIRECWLIDQPSPSSAARTVEVQPPIWIGSTTETEFALLRGSIDENGGVVDIEAAAAAGSAAAAARNAGNEAGIGRGRVYATREAAEAAAPPR